VSILANAGGIGGGALLTPIYIWLFDFSVEDAIPLSKMTIFMGAIVNYLILKNARLEDDPNQPLINYSLAGIIVPMLLAGTSVGVFGAKFFPPILILSFLSGFLVLSTFKMFVKALKMWNKETIENNKQCTEHSYSQNKAVCLTKEKNVFSESSCSIGKCKLGENDKMTTQSEADLQKAGMLNKSCTAAKLNENNANFEYAKLALNKSFDTPLKKDQNIMAFIESLKDSENSNVKYSQSQMTNPFWNNTQSVDKNSPNKQIKKEISKNIISKFKTNPGRN
jgi:hypothetical protein